MTNRAAATVGPGLMWVAEGVEVPLKPDNAGEGRDLSSRQAQDAARDLEIGQPINSGQRSETADGVARESEGRTRLPLLRPLRQDQPRRHSGARLCPVPLQQGRGLAWTVRTSRPSRRTGSSDGWANWRLRSGRRLTDRTLSDAFTYRRPTASSGRWASQPCGIGSA